MVATCYEQPAGHDTYCKLGQMAFEKFLAHKQGFLYCFELIRCNILFYITQWNLDFVNRRKRLRRTVRSVSML